MELERGGKMKIELTTFDVVKVSTYSVVLVAIRSLHLDLAVIPLFLLVLLHKRIVQSPKQLPNEHVPIFFTEVYFQSLTFTLALKEVGKEVLEFDLKIKRDDGGLRPNRKRRRNIPRDDLCH